ncbi:MAG: response regulator [Pseudomonadota bacterium]
MSSSIKQGAGSQILADRHDATQGISDFASLSDILVVEDNPIDGDRMRATLHLSVGRHAKIRRAETLASALDRVIEQVPDLVILDDYLKPNDTASDTIPFLRRAGYEGPIIVISGEVNRTRRMELVKIGASDVLHKDDVDSVQIAAALDRVLKAGSQPTA